MGNGKYKSIVPLTQRKSKYNGKNGTPQGSIPLGIAVKSVSQILFIDREAVEYGVELVDIGGKLLGGVKLGV